MNKNIFARASEMMNTRRLSAIAENDRRNAEIEQKIPEIAEINRILSTTGINLIKIIRKGEDIQQKIKSLENQNRQAQEMIASLLVRNGYPHDYLELRYNCEKCSDTGYHNGKMCNCFEELIGKVSVDHLNASSRITLCSFDSFDLSYYKNIISEENENCFVTMSKNLEYCKQYANTFSQDSKNLLMYGNPGLGKTHLSLAIAEQLLNKGVNVLYDSTVNFLIKIEKEHFRRIETDIDTYETVVNADLLILDDLGTENTTDFYRSTLYNILNTRINKGIPTIVSTNLTPDEISAKYEPRITSRIVLTYTHLKFIGKDIRGIKSSQEAKNYRANIVF